MITLDMGENRIAAFAEGMQTAFVEVPRGVMQGGRIHNPELLAQLVGAALPEGKGKARAVCFQLPSQMGQYREFTLPKLPAHKLEAALRLQYQGSVSNLEDYVLDYYEVAAGETERAYQCALVPRTLIAQYLSFAKALKRPCGGISLRLDALRRRAAAYGVDDPAFVVMLLLPGEAEVCLFEGKRAFVRAVQFQSDANRLADWGISIAGARETEEQRAVLLAQQADRLSQFQLSRNRETPVAAVYAASFAPEEPLVAATARALGREITPLPLFDPQLAAEAAETAVAQTAQKEAEAAQKTESGAAL